MGSSWALAFIPSNSVDTLAEASMVLWLLTLIDILAPIGEVRVAVVAVLALARISQVSDGAHAVLALAEHAARVAGARGGRVGRQHRHRRQALPRLDRPQEHEGDLERRPRRAPLHAQQLVGERPPVEPPLLRHEHVRRQERQRLGVVPGVEPPEVDPRGGAVVVDGRLAARHARAVLAGGLADAVHLLVAEGAEGGAAADDAGPPGAEGDLVLDQRRHQVAAGEHELVAVGQHVAVADDAAAEGDVPVGGEGAAAADDGAAAHHAHGAVAEGDLGDAERAVAEEQPRRLRAAGVTGEVEPRPVAARWPDAEGVRHAHVPAGGGAAGQPCHRRWSLRRGRHR